jgi:hypothetical protein
MPFKNWPAICEIQNPLMRAWISYEEKEETLLRAQLGFPHLFTDEPEEGKTGPFPLSYLRRLMKQHDSKEEHEESCEWDDEDGNCPDCARYSRLPDLPIPHIKLRIEEIPEEVMVQIRDRTGEDSTLPPTETFFFPYRLYEITHEGEKFYLGYIDIDYISLVVKVAVHIDE